MILYKNFRANIWQGTFPHYNSAKDGYIGTNPVHLFPQNDFQLHNMAGNVWEWTEDVWSEDNVRLHFFSIILYYRYSILLYLKMFCY